MTNKGLFHGYFRSTAKDYFGVPRTQRKHFAKKRQYKTCFLDLFFLGFWHQLILTSMSILVCVLEEPDLPCRASACYCSIASLKWVLLKENITQFTMCRTCQLSKKVTINPQKRITELLAKLKRTCPKPWASLAAARRGSPCVMTMMVLTCVTCVTKPVWWQHRQQQGTPR